MHLERLSSPRRILKRSTMRRFCIAVLFATACGGSSDSGSTQPLVTEGGTFLLASVNGVLPYVVSDVSGNKHSISTGAIILDAVRHEFVETLTDVYENPTQTSVGTTTLSGSYTRDGASLTLRLAATQGGGTIPAQVGDGKITSKEGDRTLVFVRR